jgi:hypothetical protein
MDPGSAPHRHSAWETRVNALKALRSIRGTQPESVIASDKREAFAQGSAKSEAIQ